MTYPEFITAMQGRVLQVMGKEISRERAGKIAKEIMQNAIERLSSNDIVELHKRTKGK
jgi:imidazoleglycerol phosphate dehydratase HisB